MNITKNLRAEVTNQIVERAYAKHAKQLLKTIKTINTEYWQHHNQNIKTQLGLTEEQITNAGGTGAYIMVGKQSVSIDKDYVWLATSNERTHFNKVKWLFTLFSDYSQSSYSDGLTRYLRMSHETISIKLKDMGNVSDHLLRDRILNFQTEFKALVQDIIDYHGSVSLIMESCRTLKQLEDIFPEAAKLITPPAKNTNEMIPQDIVDAVRAKLKVPA